MIAEAANHTNAERRLRRRLKMAYMVTESPTFWSAMTFAGVSCQWAYKERYNEYD
jgi:hypothetical protein